MIWAGIAVAALILVVVVSAIGSWIAGKVRHKLASDLVAKEMTKTFNAAQAAINALPDPERKFTPQEVTDALREMRNRGRSPE